MTDALRHTASETLAILSARQLKEGQVVFAGIGIPLLAATLAQRLRCPGLTILFEGGVIGAFVEPGKLPPSTNDQRCTKRANMVLGSAEVLLLLQRGYVDIGFMGGAQIDRFGNLNSSFIGDADNPKTRLPGTGGGNDISSLTNMIVAMKHEKRRFVADVDFITSPGWIKGKTSRADRGLTHRDWLFMHRQRARLRLVWADFFHSFDVLLCPVTLVPAFEHLQQGLWSDRVIDVNGRQRLYAELEGWPALIGGVYLPSTAAPVGRTDSGLPVGVQVVAPFLHDRTAIQVASWLGELAGRYHVPPAVG